MIKRLKLLLLTETRDKKIVLQCGTSPSTLWTYRETSINLITGAEWKAPPGRSKRWSCKARRMHKLVIKGYYRTLQHRYTLDLMCRRCSQRVPAPRRGRENICAYFGSIGFPACGTRFLLKALPTPSQIRFVLRFIPAIEQRHQIHF